MLPSRAPIGAPETLTAGPISLPHVRFLAQKTTKQPRIPYFTLPQVILAIDSGRKRPAQKSGGKMTVNLTSARQKAGTPIPYNRGILNHRKKKNCNRGLLPLINFRENVNCANIKRTGALLSPMASSSSTDYGNHQQDNESEGRKVRNLTRIILDLFSLFLPFLLNWLLFPVNKQINQS